jgi:hypothetical protein
MKNIARAPGALIISLDFELFWWLRDKTTLAAYGANILGSRKAVRRLLQLFSDYEIHATWATVVFLFFENRHELVAALPVVKPNYHSTVLCNYKHIKHIGLTETDDPYHFAHLLINLIEKILSWRSAFTSFPISIALKKVRTSQTSKIISEPP